MVNKVKRIKNYENYENLFCIDESIKEINPTGTFKDRQPQALKKLLENQFQNIPVTVGAMSTGNTAYSLFHFAEKYNEKQGFTRIIPVIYVPLDFEEKSYFGPDIDGKKVDGKEYLKVLEDLASRTGGKVIHLDFGKVGEKSESYLSSLRLGRVAKEKGLIREDGIYLNITEGLETTQFLTKKQLSTLSEKEYDKLPKLGIKAYQPVISDGLRELKQRFGVSPDYLICQFGAGILFNEAKDYLKINSPKTKIIPVAVGDPESCADKIYASYWTISPKALINRGKTQSIHDNSVVYGLDDQEILKSLNELKGKLNAEASGTAGFAILHRLDQIVPELKKKTDVVLTINTGNGMPNFFI